MLCIKNRLIKAYFGEVPGTVKKDKLKSLDIKYFLVHFSVLFMLFLIVTYLTVNKRIEKKYSDFEREAISITESYSYALVYSHDAHIIINDLLEEKLTVAIQAISMIEDKHDDDALTMIGDRFYIDEIYLYNSEGEIIYSKGGKYLGWKASEGHPVHNFMKSNLRFLIEDIRRDTESDNYLKYAYLKNDDGTFIQIGILADTIQSFIRRFEYFELVESISNKSDAIDVMFLSNDFEIIAGNKTSYGNIIEDEKIRKQMSRGERYSQKTILGDQDVFQVYVPVFHDGEIHGILSLIWSTDELDTEVKEIIIDGAILFIAVIIIVGIIMYYAYRKDKSNIRIAYYDKLTGLPNSDYMAEYLDEEIKNSGNRKKAILLLNCKDFKTLNMTYGFNYGNNILIQVANRVKELIEPKDKLFRFNADRFVLLVNNYRSKNELTELAERIVDVFKHQLPEGFENRYIDVEVSIVEIKQSNISVDKLLQDATLALDNIDENANERICFYEDVMEKQVMRQDKIERALRAIIENEKENNNSLTLHFQPKWNLKNNCIIGFESLSRLYVEGLGHISPLEFIDIAERRLLIYDLGKQILQKSCTFLKKLNNLGFNNIKLAVNISVIQLLRDEFVKDISEIIKSSGIDKSSLVLEITESVIMENFDLINEKLKQIRKAGVLISLDDFGTGFSSLSRLSELNIDYVKIDKYFINKITENNDEKIITADIISMSHKFGLTVIAEGVEKEEQKKYLEQNNCDILQGYLIGRPLEEEGVIDFLKSI